MSSLPTKQLKRRPTTPETTELDTTPTRTSSEYCWRDKIDAKCPVLESLWEPRPPMKLALLPRDNALLKKHRTDPARQTHASPILFQTDIALLFFEFLQGIDIVSFAQTCKFYYSLFQSSHFISNHNPLSSNFYPDKQPNIHSLVCHIDVSEYRVQQPLRPEIQAECEFVSIHCTANPRRPQAVRAVVPSPLGAWPSHRRLRQVFFNYRPCGVRRARGILHSITISGSHPNVVVIDMEDPEEWRGMIGTGIRIPLVVMRTREVFDEYFTSWLFRPISYIAMVVDRQGTLEMVSNSFCIISRTAYHVRNCGGCDLCLFDKSGAEFETSVYLKRFGNGEERLFYRDFD